ncbi:winged helix-turn-helix transcriptional regulator [Rhodoblastus sp.]|uniref:winged helix-turn-helix transcriptional regulator n=1 Tax=Rhodoblastus sp. TaxID=1962975 RepID=UPI003F97465E
MKNMTNGPPSESQCSDPELRERFSRALGVLSGKWTAEILYCLRDGTLRFGELRRAIPDITQHMLTCRLRELEADRLVTREIYAEVPPRVEYTLTPAAQALRPVFDELFRWAAHHWAGPLDSEDWIGSALEDRKRPSLPAR